ncbi:MAG: exostosin family protein, partial [Fibrobacter sp.]|nr:exostosin family protein [Fibrobacter sp.]
KKKIPTVAYAGYIDYYNLKSMILFKVRKILSKNKNSSLGPELRGKAVRLIQRDIRFKSEIIIRKGFLGGCKEHLRKEYADNMLKSDYVLVTRGAGNFSYRFYEVLSCGKIPVFIDTDCVLPFEDSINWRDYCVWVDQSEIKHLGDKIDEFHQKISDDGFIQIQKAIRSLYEEKICPSGYYKTLLNQIKLTLH